MPATQQIYSCCMKGRAESVVYKSPNIYMYKNTAIHKLKAYISSVFMQLASF